MPCCLTLMIMVRSAHQRPGVPIRLTLLTESKCHLEQTRRGDGSADSRQPSQRNKHKTIVSFTESHWQFRRLVRLTLRRTISSWDIYRDAESRSNGQCCQRRLCGLNSLRTTVHIRHLPLQHVPNDCRQASHHRHAGDHVPTTLLDPLIPLVQLFVISQ
jgi:hypothetical protein